MTRKFTIILMCSVFITLSACSSTTKLSSDEVTKRNTKVAAINVQLGIAYLEQGNIQRAKQKLDYAIQKDPQLPEVWYSLAYLYEKTGNREEAKKYYLKSIQLGASRGDVQNNYGTFLCRTGEYQESINHFLLATQDPSYLDAAGAYENAGLCALKIPNKSLARKYFNLALEQDPMRPLSTEELNKLKG